MGVNYKKLIQILDVIDSTYRDSIEKIATIIGWNTRNFISYEIKCIREAIERYATADGITVGSHVRLTDDYKFEQKFPDGQPHGWWPYRHTFTKGAGAVVREIEIAPDGDVILGVAFDIHLVELDWPPEQEGKIVDNDKHYNVNDSNKTWFHFKKRLFTAG